MPRPEGVEAACRKAGKKANLEGGRRGLGRAGSRAGRAVQSERPREELTRHLKAVECHQRSDRLTFVFERMECGENLGRASVDAGRLRPLP